MYQKELYKPMLLPGKKWEQMVKLREMAWNLKAAYLRKLHPDWNEQQIQEKVREIFLYATT